MKKQHINIRRTSAVYKFSNTLNGSQMRELLDFCLAIMPYNRMKDICDKFNIKVD